jgi:hypothetical protein
MVSPYANLGVPADQAAELVSTRNSDVYVRSGWIRTRVGAGNGVTSRDLSKSVDRAARPLPRPRHLAKDPRGCATAGTPQVQEPPAQCLFLSGSGFQVISDTTSRDHGSCPASWPAPDADSAAAPGRSRR